MIEIFKKKTVLVLFFMFSLFYTAFAKGQPLTVMSFNIQGNEGQHKDSTNFIAEIINKSNADLVLLQEVNIRDESKFPEELKKKLKVISGKEWDYRTTFGYASCAANLHNMILFNPKVIKCVKDKGAEESFRKKYKFINDKTQTLEMKYQNKKFIVVNVHFAYNSNSNETPAGESIANCEADLEQAGKLFSYYKEKNPILIGGDFNWCRTALDKPAFNSTKNCHTLIDGNEGDFKPDGAGIPTTLSRSSKQITRSRDYDHFVVSNMSIVDKLSLFLLKNGQGPIKLNGKTFSSSKKFRKYISDHLPIKIKVNF